MNTFEDFIHEKGNNFMRKNIVPSGAWRIVTKFLWKPIFAYDSFERRWLERASVLQRYTESVDAGFHHWINVMFIDSDRHMEIAEKRYKISLRKIC